MQNILRAQLVVLASSSAVEGLRRTLGPDGFRRLFRSAGAVCIGRATASTLRQHGVKPAAIAARSDLRGLVEATVRAARSMRMTAPVKKGK